MRIIWKGTENVILFGLTTIKHISGKRELHYILMTLISLERKRTYFQISNFSITLSYNPFKQHRVYFKILSSNEMKYFQNDASISYSKLVFLIKICLKNEILKLKHVFTFRRCSTNIFPWCQEINVYKQDFDGIDL